MPTAYAFSQRATAEALARSVGPTDLELPNAGVTAGMFIVKLKFAITAYNPSTGAPQTDAQLLTNTTNGGFVDTSENGVKQKEVKVYNIFTHSFPADSMHICGRLDGRLFIIHPFSYRTLVRFTLDFALTTSDSVQTATLTDQYGMGVDNDTSAGAALVYNMETSSAGTYLFEGNSGDAGLAIWDKDNQYRIIQIECPDTTGGGDGGGDGGDGGGGDPGGGGTP